MDELTIEDVNLSAFVILHAVEAIIHQAHFYDEEGFDSSEVVAEATRLILAYLTAK